MKIFPPTIDICPEEGFEKKDLFGYSTFGSELGHLFLNAEDPLVVALDDNWGVGKTTFVKMWMGYVRKELDCYPIYFDAFANDFASDPFTAISAAFSKIEIKPDENPSEDFQEAMANFKSTAIRVGGVFIRGAAGLAVRSLTAGFVDADTLKQINLKPEDIIAATTTAADSLMESQIQAAEDNQALFNALRKSISDLQKSLPTGSGPLIIIVDELDRCKPSFAIGLVEVLKHFFSVEGVHFLLSVNMRQLGESVRAIYGLQTGADAYLRKFIHLSRTLPEPSKGERRTLYIDNLIKSMELPLELGGEGKSIETQFILTHFLNRRGYSLRDIDRAISNLAIVIASRGGPKNLKCPGLTATLAITSAVDPEFFEKCRNTAYRLNDYSGVHSPTYFDFLLESSNELDRARGEIYRYVFGPEWTKGQARTYLDSLKTFNDRLFVEWTLALAPPDSNERHQLPAILRVYYDRIVDEDKLRVRDLLQVALNEVGRLGAPGEI